MSELVKRPWIDTSRNLLHKPDIFFVKDASSPIGRTLVTEVKGDRGIL